MRDRNTSKSIADYVRANHVYAGGAKSTKELAAWFNISQRYVLYLVRNEKCVNPDYKPQNLKKQLTPEIVAYLNEMGLDNGAIGSLFGVSVSTIADKQEVG